MFEETFLYGQQRRSDAFGFSIVKSGYVKCNVNLNGTVFRTDDLFVFSPNSVVQVDYISDDCEIESLCFTEAYLMEVVGNVNAGIEDFLSHLFLQHTFHWTLSATRSTFFKTILAELNALSTRTAEMSLDMEKDICRQAFHLFFLQLTAIAKDNAIPLVKNYSRKEQLVFSFFSLVREHFRQQRQVSFYADKLFVTPKYLSEIVKKTTGKPASDIIDHFVAKEAKLLLNSPLLNVSQVSEKLNFPDQSVFGKYFKRVTGLSPKHFRETTYNRTGIAEFMTFSE